MSAVAKIIIGAVLITAVVLSGGALAPLLLQTGLSLIIGGIGSLLSKKPPTPGTASRNPIAPWDVIYGRARLGGTVVYIEENGDTNKYLHQVIVLACHPCQAVEQLLFNNKRVVLDTNGNSISFGDSTAVIGHQQSQNIASITRSNDVVTVTLTAPLPPPAGYDPAFQTLVTADMLSVQNVGVDHTLNGTFPVTVISATVLTYVCGGNPVTVTNQGQVYTTYPDYGDTVHMEVVLGNHTATFPGLLAMSNGLWTSEHLLQGRTAVYLRLKYGGKTYANGLPTIGFVVQGKNDIFDPRSGVRGFSENAALCIADYLAHPTWGFKAVYGTEIPAPDLIAAANICDEPVAIAVGGTEPRYACNGTFPLTTKRGEVLQNLLTSCAGRLTYTSGRFGIHPGSWSGASFSIGGDFRVGERIIVPATAGTIVTDWEDQLNGGDQSFGNGTLQIAFDGHGGATMQFLGTAAFTIYRNDYGVAGQKLAGANVGAGPTAIPNLPSAGSELVVQIFSSDGIFISGPAGANQDGSAHCRISSRSGGYGLPPSIASLGSSLAQAAGPFTWRPTVSVSSLYNGVKGIYVSPVNNWQSSDFPRYAQDSLHGYSGPAQFGGDANLAADAGDRRWLDMQLPFTISCSTAQRLAKIELMRRRQQGSGTFVYNLALYQTTALDVVSFTFPTLNWRNKLLEITGHSFTQTKQTVNGLEVTLLGTELQLNETDPSVYDWNVSEELTPEGFRQAALPDNTVVAPPTSVVSQSGAITSAIGADGIARSRVQVAWTAPTDGYVLNGGHMEVRYQPVGATVWTGLPQVDPSVTQTYIDGVSDNTAYSIQVRSVNAAGVASNWQPTTATASGTPSVINYSSLQGVPTIPTLPTFTVNGH